MSAYGQDPPLLSKDTTIHSRPNVIRNAREIRVLLKWQQLPECENSWESEIQEAFPHFTF